jgi:hypothetical protein
VPPPVWEADDLATALLYVPLMKPATVKGGATRVAPPSVRLIRGCWLAPHFLVVFTVQVLAAGVGSTLPAASIALTRKVC